MELQGLEPQHRGPAPQVGGIERPGSRHHAAVVLPEPALLAGAARGAGRRHGLGVAVEREVEVDEADLARVALQHLVDHGLRAVAVRALVVGELHDRHGGRGGSGRRRSGRDRDRRTRRVEPDGDLGLAAQLLLERGAPFGDCPLAQDLADPRERLVPRGGAEARLVLLVDLLDVGRGGRLCLGVDLLLQQLLGGDAALLRLGRDEALGDQLVEHLAADVELVLADADQPVGRPLVELGGQDRAPVHLGDDSGAGRGLRAGGCRRSRPAPAGPGARRERKRQGDGDSEAELRHSNRLNARRGVVKPRASPPPAGAPRPRRSSRRRSGRPAARC